MIARWRRGGGGGQRDVSAVQRDGARRGEINRAACCQRQIGGPCIDVRSDADIAGRCRRYGGIARRWRVRRGQNDELAIQRHRCARETELAIAIPAREQAQISRAGINVRGDGYIIRRAELQNAQARWRSACAG